VKLINKGVNMAYTQQILILEEKLTQLKKSHPTSDNIQKTVDVESAIKRLKRLEWIENYETIKLEEDR
jgi:hypothetical protein